MKKRSSPVMEDMGDEAGGDRQFVTALSRGLDILRCFEPTDGPLGNADLAQRCGLPKATVSRLTYTLAKLGYLDYLPDSGKYRMGVAVLGLGYACLGGLKIRETAQPYLQALADHAGDGVLTALAGRDDLSMVYIACARAPGMVSLQQDVGSRLSLGRSSIGRAYLAALDQPTRAQLMERLRQRAGEEFWPMVERGILRSADEIRARGFCLNVGEWVQGVNSVAVPLRPTQPGQPPLAFNCGGPSYILTPERLEKELGPRLVELANRVALVGRAV
ncbi:IclR family transcriptional regulator [Nitrospirillum amazonense]|uniref:IclR family transcriptional regulator n=1 Tax=Nitrospirillum amazonense TaxID=28077 RepID=A0A560KIE8_9PROT|nr:IclR family transcriptional regulator [Nitrospirillum amazonense]MDG3444344.1 IclR family transcriptional regulator [Nitrospirillum amazonense]TWB83053.1 IclR family transcriptional regulator [Nitrospirillum amazonense]